MRIVIELDDDPRDVAIRISHGEAKAQAAVVELDAGPAQAPGIISAARPEPAPPGVATTDAGPAPEAGDS